MEHNLLISKRKTIESLFPMNNPLHAKKYSYAILAYSDAFLKIFSFYVSLLVSIFYVGTPGKSISLFVSSISLLMALVYEYFKNQIF